MTALQVWMEGASAKALGATLLHSLWEGAAVALALALVLMLTRSPRIRYAAACVAMAAIFVGFGVTFYRLMPHDTGVAVQHVLPQPVRPAPDDVPGPSIRSTWDASDLLPWLAPVWMAGVLLFQIRCLASWLAAGRLGRTGVCIAPDRWVARLDGLRARLRMTKPVRLLESYLAEVPVVIGHLRPVILMPVGLLDRLPLGQIESILLHELAHIRRADYLVNLLQTLMEGLLFYHPAVWWISSVIRTERENCCDDLVVATSGDAHEYATALAALAENRFTMRDAAMAATGGSLVKRIRRLLAQPEGPRVAAPVLSAAILVVTCAVAMAAWQPGQQSQPAISPSIPLPTVPVLQSQAASSPPPPILTEKQRGAMERLRGLRQRPVELAQIPYVPHLFPMNSLPLMQSGTIPYSNPYLKWLNEEVAYIITDAERNAFKGLRTDDERNMFIRQFWARRDPSYPKAASQEEYPVIAKGNPENEFKKEHYRRIKYVNDRFADQKIAGWKTDRGRIYIQYGPPDEIESHPSGGAYTRPPAEGGGQIQTHPFEQWMYRYIDGIGKNVIIEFVDTTGTGEFHMTMDPNEKNALLFVPRAGVTVFRLLGGSGNAVLEVGPDRKMQASIPFEFQAKEYLFTLSAAQQDGQAMWSKSELVRNTCGTGNAEPSCAQNYPHKMTTYAPSGGSYTITVEVRDNESPTHRSYTAVFTVN